jgi:hypothetical protein
MSDGAYPLPDPEYLCNCGRSFSEHLARVAHAASCYVMEAFREAADLRRRIDRALDYTDSLLRVPDLNSDLVIVLQAVHNSLCTPVASGDDRG